MAQDKILDGALIVDEDVIGKMNRLATALVKRKCPDDYEGILEHLGIGATGDGFDNEA